MVNKITGRWTLARTIAGVIFAGASLGSWFFREFIRAWFFDRILHITDPILSDLVEFGIPAAFALLTIWLLFQEKPGARFRGCRIWDS